MFIQQFHEPALAVMCRVIPGTADSLLDTVIEGVIVTAVTQAIAIAVVLIRVGNVGAVVLATPVAEDDVVVTEQSVRVLYFIF